MTEEVTETAEETTKATETPSGSLLENVDVKEEFNSVDNPDGHPEWFKHQKYGSVEDQAKAYNELEKKLGGFTGAPDEYELTLAEGLEYDVEADDPLLNDFKEIAKSQNMSQEAFNKFANLYIEQQIAHSKLEEEFTQNHVAEQMKALGDKGEDRLQNVASWAKATLGDEGLFNKFADGLQSAGMVEVFEALMSATGNVKQNTHHNTPPAPALTKADLEAMQFEKDEFGNRKMASDPEHRRKVEEGYAQLHGKKHTSQILG